MLQQFCLWKWLAVGIAVATILASSLAQNDEGKVSAVGGMGWFCDLFGLPGIMRWTSGMILAGKEALP